LPFSFLTWSAAEFSGRGALDFDESEGGAFSLPLATTVGFDRGSRLGTEVLLGVGAAGKAAAACPLSLKVMATGDGAGDGDEGDSDGDDGHGDDGMILRGRWERRGRGTSIAYRATSFTRKLFASSPVLC